MQQRGVAVGPAALGHGVGLLGQLAEGHPGLEQLDVVMDLLPGQAVQPALLVARPAGPTEVGARDVGAVAEGPDQVGVVGDQVARPDHPVAALLEPGVGALARGQQPGLDPFAAHSDVGVVQDGPELVLGHARLERLAHARHGGLADRDRLAHAGELLRRLDGAGDLQDLLAVPDLDPEVRQRRSALRLAVVQRQAPVAAAVGRHQVGDLGGPGLGALLETRPGAEVVPGDGGPHLVDRFQAGGQVLAVVEVEHHDRPLGGDEAVAHGVVQGPDRHVAAARRVADVDRVVEHGPGVVALPELLAHAPQPIAAQRDHVDVRFGVDQGRDGELGGRLAIARHGHTSPDRPRREYCARGRGPV